MYPNIFNIDHLFCSLSKEQERHIFGYVGLLSSENIDSLINEVETTLDGHVDSRVAKKRIFSILLESLQNLSAYIEQDGIDEFRDALVCVNRDDESYYVYVGNFIMKRHYPSIESRIKIINALTNEQLRQLYRSILDYGSVTKTGGAGLGFIDVAKRSDEVVLHQYEDINEDIAFFTLKIVVAE
ncbi:hypothetical protein FNH22_29635 [Fulvivirga sp. M361]|uniref:SiaB family protein kinase n=1 Tax=Fulvivirga sp. M361 TaxID=2594266 RepID=UPI001179FA3A|nr:SiaB family protein kinase [Fulvivirga sp. M361]TRX48124.1 hypothetical protein FNH22_29635 [Fulvivirga sp. M361]